MTWISSAVKAKEVCSSRRSKTFFPSLTRLSDVQEFHAAQQGEAKLRELCDAERPGMMGDAQSITTAMASVLPEVDKAAILRDPAFGNYLSQSFREGLQQSCDGWIDDDLAFLQPWGFDVGENKTPVLLYQGSDDKMVPFAHGKWIAKHLPESVSQIRLLEGHGHISIFLDHVDEMIDGLLKHY